MKACGFKHTNIHIHGHTQIRVHTCGCRVWKNANLSEIKSSCMIKKMATGREVGAKIMIERVIAMAFAPS